MPWRRERGDMSPKFTMGRAWSTGRFMSRFTCTPNNRPTAYARYGSAFSFPWPPIGGDLTQLVNHRVMVPGGGLQLRLALTGTLAADWQRPGQLPMSDQAERPALLPLTGFQLLAW